LKFNGFKIEIFIEIIKDRLKIQTSGIDEMKRKRWFFKIYQNTIGWSNSKYLFIQG